MAQNAAIHYHGEGYDTSGARLMGRHAAGEGFLAGFVRHSGVESLCCFARARADFDDFTRRVARLAGASRPTRWVPHGRIGELADPGCLYVPGPNIAELAWLRRHAGARAFSLCGVTHTTASGDAMDALGRLLIAPLQPWDALICTSKAVRDSLEPLLDRWAEYLDARLGGRARTPVLLPIIPLGVDCDSLGDRARAARERPRLRRRLGIEADEVVVLFLGRLSFHAKAHPLPMYLGLESAARATGRRVRLIQAGWFANAGIERQFKDAAAAYCPSVGVTFLDGRDAAIRRSIWFAADLFSSLSDNVQETFGLAPLEAMAAGLPVVVSDWNGYRDTVRDGLDGLLVPTLQPPAGAGGELAFRHAAGIDSYDRYIGHASQCTSVDPVGAARAYTQLIGDPERRRRIGERARRRAREAFDWRVVIAAYQALWEEQADRRTRAPAWPPEDPGPAPHPLRPDPFALFANYASRALEPDTRLALAPEAGIERMRRLRADPINAFAAPILASPEDCEALLARLADTGSCTVAEALEPVAPERRARMHRSLAWLAKLGILHVTPRDA